MSVQLPGCVNGTLALLFGLLRRVDADVLQCGDSPQTLEVNLIMLAAEAHSDGVDDQLLLAAGTTNFYL